MEKKKTTEKEELKELVKGIKEKKRRFFDALLSQMNGMMFYGPPQRHLLTSSFIACKTLLGFTNGLLAVCCSFCGPFLDGILAFDAICFFFCLAQGSGDDCDGAKRERRGSQRERIG